MAVDHKWPQVAPGHCGHRHQHQQIQAYKLQTNGVLSFPNSRYNALLLFSHPALLTPLYLMSSIKFPFEMPRMSFFLTRHRLTHNFSFGLKKKKMNQILSFTNTLQKWRVKQIHMLSCSSLVLSLEVYLSVPPYLAHLPSKVLGPSPLLHPWPFESLLICTAVISHVCISQLCSHSNRPPPWHTSHCTELPPLHWEPQKVGWVLLILDSLHVWHKAVSSKMFNSAVWSLLQKLMGWWDELFC